MKRNFYLIFLIFSLSACSKSKSPETPPPDNVSQLVIYPGDERVKLSFAIEDKSVQYCDIFWNNKSESRRVNRSEATAGIITTYINGLEEGNHSFEIISYTESGIASSNVARIQSKVYGDSYRADIDNRTVNDLYFLIGKTPHIDWHAAHSQEVEFGVNYTDTDNKIRSVRIAKEESRLLLPDYKEHTEISYQAYYLPEHNCIDTFITSKSILPAPPLYASAVVKLLVERSGGFINKIISQSATDLHADVEYTSLQFQNSSGSPFSLFVVKADLSKNNATVTALMPNNETSFALQDVKKMAEHRDAAGDEILAAVNADFFDWSPVAGRPWGPVVVEGTIVKDFVKAEAGITSYFGVKKDGTLAIGQAPALTAGEYNNFQNLTGAGTNILINNGVRQVHNDAVREPRTMIGYTDNKVVYIMVVDGRRAGYSVGMTLDEIAVTIGSLGVRNATNLDGGGSSTMVLKDNAENFEIVNRYSDASPRAVANGLAIKLIE